MASDEKREVAERLRQMADAHHAVEASRVARALGFEYEVYGAVVAFGAAAVQSLADLIDRPTCRNLSGFEDMFECSECRCKAELICEVCNEHGEPFSVPLMPSYCPVCGARVVKTGD